MGEKPQKELQKVWMKSGVQKKHLGTPPEVTWVLVENRVYRIPQNLIVDHHVPH